MIRPWVCILIFAALVPMAWAQKKATEVYEFDGTWKKVAEPDPSTHDGYLHEIRKAIADQRPDTAIAMADQWIQKNPRHPLTDQAYLLRGDAKVAKKHYFEALFDYEYLLRMFPGSTWFDVALEREFHIARAFAHGTKRRLWGIRMISAYDEAEELFIRIWERREGSALAERALFELSEMLYRQGYMRRAVDAYDMFLINYPKSQWSQHAMKKLVQAALATFKGPRYDPTGLLDARRRLLDFKKRFPAAAEQMDAVAILNRVDESLAARSLEVAQWYERNRKWISARHVYLKLIKDPNLRHTASALKAWDRLVALGHSPAGPKPGEPATDGTKASEVAP